MARLPLLSGREIIQVLCKLGYRKVRQRGSHIRLYCSGKKSISVPNHRIVGRGLLRKILRDAEISVSELRILLK
ncbi:type II toxin-antitoxin system HicA family toxin [Candidatus Falkowbacteria bacterium]|nr:type II toxin-antitoxin system HicA family toxin [Candidatus Falkowbacteria bacterium]